MNLKLHEYLVMICVLFFVSKEMNTFLNNLTKVPYHMCTSGIFNICHCPTVMYKNFSHMLFFFIRKPNKTYSCTMERLQFILCLKTMASFSISCTSVPDTFYKKNYYINETIQTLSDNN